MKKIIVTAVIALLSFSGIAQDTKSRSVENRIQKRVDVLSEKLNLTESQEKEIYALYTEVAEDNNKAKANTGNALSKTNKKLDKDYVYNKLKEILTPEQYEILMKEN